MHTLKGQPWLNSADYSLFLSSSLSVSQQRRISFLKEECFRYWLAAGGQRELYNAKYLSHLRKPKELAGFDYFTAQKCCNKGTTKDGQST